VETLNEKIAYGSGHGKLQISKRRSANKRAAGDVPILKSLWTHLVAIPGKSPSIASTVEGWIVMKEGRDRSHLAGIAVGCAVLLVGMMAILVIATEPAWPGRTSGSIEGQANP
jgi:hypothetical protein